METCPRCGEVEDIERDEDRWVCEECGLPHRLRSVEEQIMGTLEAVEEPLPLETLHVRLAYTSTVESGAEARETVCQALDALDRVLSRDMTPDGETGYTLNGDFARSKVDQNGGGSERTREARRVLAEMVTDWATIPEGPPRNLLARRGIPMLLGDGRAEEARELLCTLEFVQFVCESAGPCRLADFFERTAEKLTNSPDVQENFRVMARAARIDRQFLRRHPEHLFQQMFNRCWWHDSPETERHYEEPDGGWTDPAWERQGERLCELMETWRSGHDREAERPWIRSGRPPFSRVDSPLHAVFCGHEARVTSVAYGPRGRRAVSGSRDGTLRVWDIVGGEEIARFAEHADAVCSVDFSPAGRRVASGSRDETVRVWDLDDGVEIAQLEGHTHWVKSVAFGPEGRRVASGSRDDTLRVWDITRGHEVTSIDGHSDSVHSVDFGPEGEYLASGSSDTSARIWAVETGEPLARLDGHEDVVESVAFGPRGRRLATSSWDETVRVWRVREEREIARFDGHAEKVHAVAFGPQGNRVASGSSDDSLRVWDVSGRREPLRLEGHGRRVASIVYGPDGRRVTRSGGGSSVRSLDFDPEGRRLLSGSNDRSLQLWNVDSHEELAQLDGHTDAVNCIAVEPEGERAVSGSADETLRIWNIASGEQVDVFRKHTTPVTAVAFGPDGERLISGAQIDFFGRGATPDNLLVWSMPDGEVLASMKAHSSPVTAVALSPDGRRAVSGSGDETVRVWNVQNEEEIGCFEGHSARIREVAFGPDDGCVVSAAEDESVRIWDVGTGECREMIEGTSDIGAVLSDGDDETTEALRAVAGEREVAIVRDAKPEAEPVARMPMKVEATVLAPGSPRRFVGRIDDHVVCFTVRECDRGPADSEEPGEVVFGDLSEPGTHEASEPSRPRNRLDELRDSFEDD